MIINVPTKLEDLNIGKVVSLGFLKEEYDREKKRLPVLNECYSNLLDVSKKNVAKLSEKTIKEVDKKLSPLIHELAQQYALIHELKLYKKDFVHNGKTYTLMGDELPFGLWQTTLDNEIKKLNTNKSSLWKDWKYIPSILSKMAWHEGENPITRVTSTKTEEIKYYGWKFIFSRLFPSWYPKEKTIEVTGEADINWTHITNKRQDFYELPLDALNVFAFFLSCQTGYLKGIKSKPEKEKRQVQKEKNIVTNGDGAVIWKTSSPQMKVK